MENHPESKVFEMIISLDFVYGQGCWSLEVLILKVIACTSTITNVIGLDHEEYVDRHKIKSHIKW